MFKVKESYIQESDPGCGRKSLSSMKNKGKSNNTKIKVSITFSYQFLSKMSWIFQSDILLDSNVRKLVAVERGTLDMFFDFDNIKVNDGVDGSEERGKWLQVIVIWIEEGKVYGR